MLYFNEEENEIQDEQLSLILGSTFVISFQERVGDVFNPVRERIRIGRFQIKKRKSLPGVPAAVHRKKIYHLSTV